MAEFWRVVRQNLAELLFILGRNLIYLHLTKKKNPFRKCSVVSHQKVALLTRNMAGRPTNSLLTANFTQLEKKDDSSGRYYWQCNYCPDDSPTGGRILGRDNKPLLHLIDAIKCPNAPATARHEVRVWLIQQGKLLVNAGPVLTSASALLPNMASTSAVTSTKKRKGAQLNQYAIAILSSAQEEEANLKFFR